MNRQARRVDLIRPMPTQSGDRSSFYPSLRWIAPLGRRELNTLLMIAIKTALPSRETPFGNTSLSESLADEIRPVFGVEELTFGLVGTLIGVCSKEVTLGLQQVRRGTLGTVGVVVAE